MSPDPTHDWWRELRALGIEKFEWSDREWSARLFDGTVVCGALPLALKPADVLGALRDAIANRSDPGAVVDGAVVGFRAWALDAGGDLTGTGDGSFLPWADSGPARAKCAAGGGHPAPAHACSCGLYGLYGNPPIVSWRNPIRPYGAFRAEYGRVVLLAIPDGTPKAIRLAIEATAERYGADTCPLDILEAAAREHGDPVPRELRPESEPAAAGPAAGAAFSRLRGSAAARDAAFAAAERQARELCGRWNVLPPAS